MIDILIKGLPEMNKSLVALEKMAPEKQKRALALGAVALSNSWKDWSSGPRGPRRIGRKTGYHVQSIREKAERGGFRQVVSTRAGYAVYHETGTKTLPKRPHMAPALKETAPVLQKLFEGKTKEAMKLAEKAANKHARMAHSILLGREVAARGRAI